MPTARSPGSARSPPLRASPPGTRTTRRPPRSQAPHEPTAPARSCAGRLGPGPDGGDPLAKRARASLFEVAHRGLAERARPGVGDAAFDRPAGDGDDDECLSRRRAEAEPGADDTEQLDGAVAIDFVS